MFKSALKCNHHDHKFLSFVYWSQALFSTLPLETIFFFKKILLVSMLGTGCHSVRLQKDSLYPPNAMGGIWEQLFIQSEQKKERNIKFISSQQSTHTVMINMHLSGELLFLPLKLVLLKSHLSSKSSNCTTVCDHLIICVFFSRWYLENTPYILEYFLTFKCNITKLVSLREHNIFRVDFGQKLINAEHCQPFI